MQHLKKILADRRGFTLLEMALVVAIIGLLAGSLVAGKSYIKNARLTTMVNETRYYVGALEQFEQRYGAVAGDMINATNYWSNVGNGDGNGLINMGNAGEVFYVFQHLARAGFITGSYTGAAGGGGAYDSIPGTNVPAGIIPSSGYYFDDQNAAIIINSNGVLFEGYYIHPLFAGLRIPGNVPGNNFVSPADAFKVDAKFDDGNPGLGWIRTFQGSVNTGCVSGNIAATAVYLTSTAVGCRLIFTLQ